MKSKLILIAAIIVGLVVYIVLSLSFDALGIATESYGYAPNWADESLEWSENMSFAGLYSVLIGVLLGTKAHWLLTGKVPGYRDIDKIEKKIGWWYFIIGSTIWAVAIYLIGLIDIKPALIAEIIDATLTVSIVYFLYKDFVSKIKRINAELAKNME